MSDKTVGTLNRLISLCRDGEEFYALAADKISAPRLEEQFRGMGRLHREIGAELQPYVTRAGGSSSEGGTLAGQTRQIFASLKALFGSDTTQTWIAKLESAEKAVVNAFQDALDDPIDDEAREQIKARLGDVREAHQRMRALQQGEGRA